MDIKDIKGCGWLLLEGDGGGWLLLLLACWFDCMLALWLLRDINDGGGMDMDGIKEGGGKFVCCFITKK